MRQAIQAVDEGMSLRSAGEFYGIPRSTLTNYVANGNTEKHNKLIELY